MKTNALLAFFFFLVALFASTRAEFVFDSNGNRVVSGDSYILVPTNDPHAAIAGAEIQNRDGSCSFAVVELLSNNGSATTIESIPQTNYITTDSRLNISFNPLPVNNCTKDPEWLVSEDAEIGHYAVNAGEDGAFLPIPGRFHFNPANATNHYHLVFCIEESDLCGSVGLYIDGHENRRLIVPSPQESVEPLVLKLDVAPSISMVV